MPSFSFLTSTVAAAVALLACSSNTVSAEPNFIKQSVDGLTTSWHQAHGIVQEGFKEWFPKLPYPSSGEKDGFKSFSHPAFPEYSMRYKQPALCDPNVKQVRNFF